jgi:AsmA-like C-terminal region
MEQIPLVQLIGSVLQMDVKDIELKQAQLDLRAGEGKVFVDSLVMEASNASLTAKGTTTFEGKLDLAARLAVDSKLSRKLPGWVDANFQPVPGGDWRDIAFAINGTLAKPQTDLVQVMVGQKLGNQFMNLLQSLTGKSKKKSGDKKKTQPEPTPTTEDSEAEPQPAANP